MKRLNMPNKRISELESVKTSQNEMQVKRDKK